MMFRRYLFFAILVTVPTCLNFNIARGQLLHDSAATTLVKKEIDCIYNFQFEEARQLYTRICRSYPEHPVVYLLRGMITYWENFPLLHTSSAGISFEEDMTRCIELSEKNNNPDYAAEYLLSDLCSRGMLLLYYADNDLSGKVFPLTISTYHYIRHSFNFTSACTDLFYFTGIYNYYREAYPRIYPVYKPLASLFPSGDIEMGLKDLRSAASGSIVMGPESVFMLSWLYLNFENNYPMALNHCLRLHELYPANTLYLSNYIKSLLLLKKYDEAEDLISSCDSVENRYFRSQVGIFKGILQEKKCLNYELALQYYKKGITETGFFGDYGNEYAAYAYFGLSRISEARGQKSNSRKYRHEAVKRVDFKKVNFD